MSAFASLLTPAVMFFALGAGAQAFRADLKFPPDLVKALSIYLLVGIGLHGGAELANASFGTAVQAVLAALVLGTALPLIAYVILVKAGRLKKLDAAAIAAHYGSVSAGTFLAASAYLQSKGAYYEEYPVIMLAIMETPAIIVGLVLAQSARSADARSSSPPTARSGAALPATPRIRSRPDATRRPARTSRRCCSARRRIRRTRRATITRATSCRPCASARGSCSSPTARSSTAT